LGFSAGADGGKAMIALSEACPATMMAAQMVLMAGDACSMSVFRISRIGRPMQERSLRRAGNWPRKSPHSSSPDVYFQLAQQERPHD
jgi:hypothetical protein